VNAEELKHTIRELQQEHTIARDLADYVLSAENEFAIKHAAWTEHFARL